MWFVCGASFLTPALPAYPLPPRGGPRAELRATDVLLDLYCGTGSIGLTLAAACRHVHGVEVSAAAVRDAERNAALNGIANASFLQVSWGELTGGETPPQPNQLVLRQPSGLLVCRRPSKDSKLIGKCRPPPTPSACCHFLVQGDLQKLQLQGLLPHPDVVVVDPARPGLSPAVVDYLRECGARRVVYVSCNASTQARDIALLCGGGGGGGGAAPYRLVSVQPCDLFPQTWHVETVAVLDAQRA